MIDRDRDAYFLGTDGVFGPVSAREVEELIEQGFIERRVFVVNGEEKEQMRITEAGSREARRRREMGNDE